MIVGSRSLLVARRREAGAPFVSKAAVVHEIRAAAARALASDVRSLALQHGVSSRRLKCARARKQRGKEDGTG